MATPAGAYYRPDISRIHFGDFELTLLAEKAPRAFNVAIAAPHRMALPYQQLRQQRAGSANSHDEYSHRLETVP